MIYIPGDKFIMGTSIEQKHRLATEYNVNPDLFEIQIYREVDVSPFFIDKYPVTNCQYLEFIKDTGHRHPIIWIDKGYPSGMDNYPVTGIDYEDACVYARWAGKRLPTEEEWEKAARGDDGRLWPWGNIWEQNACKMDNAGKEPMKAQPSPVGSYPRDCSVYGVMDMAGNVTEWVHHAITEGYTAMTKGGSFANSQPYNFICATRNAQPKGNGLVGYIGFRCVQDADKIKT